MTPASRSACLAIVPGAGSAFDSAARFLRNQPAESLLAAEALVRSVIEVPATVSDPGVALVKLKWWRDAVADAVVKGAHQHPVIQAALDTGALAHWREEAWNDGVLAIGLQCDGGPFNHTDALLDWHCNARGGLEMALLRKSTEARDAGLAMAVLEPLESWLVNGGEPTWLPLDVLARKGGMSAQAHADDESVRAALVGELAGAVLSRVRKPSEVQDCPNALETGLSVRDHVVFLRLARLAKAPASVQRRGIVPTLGEVFSTWRHARRATARMAS
ncbi:hypothetical protein F3N42_06775 [Marinihelvus fidelis]|uniref:Phytoene synthase n=1 Tax=Marinihelvus fidelis TaxID=2613842 RepID=A0A5N0TDE7_9GAMM|nr:squalene/phytoene synthase family protein [Marinihelvus fidelis]KAA9131876.1 hypothetical protein F3N42_06775 [Marinihelvus fidelis]